MCGGGATEVAANHSLDLFGHLCHRAQCGDPWVDEHGREWLTLEICWVLNLFANSLAMAGFSKVQIAS